MSVGWIVGSMECHWKWGYDWIGNGIKPFDRPPTDFVSDNTHTLHADEGGIP